MAITWKNIEAPDFRGAQFGLSEASKLIGGAIDTVGALANQQRQFNINEQQQQEGKQQQQGEAKTQQQQRGGGKQQQLTNTLSLNLIFPCCR